MATSWRDSHDTADDLLIVDGPLRGRTHLARTVGYVRTHHAAYLRRPGSGHRVARPWRAQPGVRDWGRPGSGILGTSGWPVVRPRRGPPWFALECSPDLPTDEVVLLADKTTALLPPLASTPHKDSRAPQNLVPIGGLERQLRHRLATPPCCTARCAAP